MIQEAHFQNFKALRDVRADFGALCVIVGPNASGKTSILQGLQYASLLAFDRPAFVFRGVNHPVLLRSAGATDPVLLDFDGTWAGRKGHVELNFSDQADNAGVGPTHWSYRIGGNWGGSTFGKTGPLDEPDLPAEELSRLNVEYLEFLQRDASLLRRLIAGTVFLRLESGRLAKASYSDERIPVMEGDGTGLASVLADLKLTDSERFAALESALRAVIPTVRQIRIDRAKVRRTERERATVNGETVVRPIEREYWGHDISLDMVGAPNTWAQAVSEGTLLVLGLLTALMSGGERSLVLLDDLDRGLHPKAMEALVAQLRLIQVQRPGLQIVATTHSPYLVDHVKPEEVRLTSLRPDGSVVFGSLQKHHDFARWKDSMLPGEFWSTVGEQWLAQQGSPTHAGG